VVVISFSCDSPLAYFFDKKIFTLDKKSRKILSLFLSEAANAFGKVCSDYHNTSPLDFSNAPVGLSQLMQGYLVEFLFSIMRNNSSELVSSIEPTQDARQLAENSLTDSIVYYLADHLSETPSLDSLCKHFSVSRTYLCRIFKEATGTSPVNYWISLKMQEAKRLIREGNKNITQISEHLGYSNIHHFTRMFRRFTGMPPSAYKASIKQ